MYLNTAVGLGAAPTLPARRRPMLIRIPTVGFARRGRGMGAVPAANGLYYANIGGCPAGQIPGMSPDLPCTYPDPTLGQIACTGNAGCPPGGMTNPIPLADTTPLVPNPAGGWWIHADSSLLMNQPSGPTESLPVGASNPVVYIPVPSPAAQLPAPQVSAAPAQSSPGAVGVRVDPAGNPISLAPSTVPAAASTAAVSSAVSDFMSSSFSLAGYTVPAWAAVLGVLGGGWLLFGGKGGR